LYVLLSAVVSTTPVLLYVTDVTRLLYVTEMARLADGTAVTSRVLEPSFTRTAPLCSASYISL
jgi:hypothetical protein